MNSLEFAFEQELQLEQYYQELAAMAPVRAIRELFTMLAQAKRAHATALEQVCQEVMPILKKNQVLSRGSDLVRKFSRSSFYVETDQPHLELYEGACEVELQTEQFYVKQALKTDIPVRKKLFDDLSREVHKHYVLLDSLCHVLTKMAEPEPMFA